MLTWPLHKKILQKNQSLVNNLDIFSKILSFWGVQGFQKNLIMRKVIAVLVKHTMWREINICPALQQKNAIKSPNMVLWVQILMNAREGSTKHIFSDFWVMKYFMKFFYASREIWPVPRFQQISIKHLIQGNQIVISGLFAHLSQAICESSTILGKNHF